MGIADLKKKRGLSGLSELTEKLVQHNANTSRDGDDRFWNLRRGKDGNAKATLRFLPAPEGEEVPWVKVFSHGFKGPSGKWYIENSLRTIDLPDPVYEFNNKMYNSGNESDKNIVKSMTRRKTHYICNVLIIEDPANPENEGQVKLFKMNSPIWDKVKAAMQPEDEDIKQINPFDLWEGANFKLKVSTVGEYANYDKSFFVEPAPVLKGSDAEFEALWKRCHRLNEFVEAKQFKSYEELKKRFDSVMAFDEAPIAKLSAPKKLSTVVDHSEEAEVTEEDAVEDELNGGGDLSFLNRLVQD